MWRFDEFMQKALYDPEKGYYTQGPSHVGKNGDFFTSVSVGSLFGKLLARRFYYVWQEMGNPKPFYITELGANDGQLAQDIMEGALEVEKEFASALSYTIVEPLEVLHQVQREKTQNKVHLVKTYEEIPQGAGVIFGNELLDAFPVRLFVVRQQRWKELYVQLDMSTQSRGYVWLEKDIVEGECPPVDPSLLAEGYTTEWRSSDDDFLQRLSNRLTKGLVLFIDYGRPERDYYAAFRQKGTLRTYYQHKRTDDPLIHVGDQDITADVNFTAVGKAGVRVGLSPVLYAHQSQWLTSLAKDLLLACEKNPPQPSIYRRIIGQFQTLTHPSQMGLLFHVLELSKGGIKGLALMVNHPWQSDLEIDLL